MGFAGVIAVYLVYRLYLSVHLESFLLPIINRPSLVLLVFTISESFVGIIPPEFFLIWAVTEDVSSYIQFVFIFSAISYLGGSFNFLLGKFLHNRRFFKRMTILAMRKYAPLYNEYGGWVILIAGFTPLPFATISLVSGALGFDSKKYFLFALARFVRFFVYAFIIWHSGITDPLEVL